MTFGEALVGYATAQDDLRSGAQFTRFAGGADLNVAVGLRLLGVDTTWASVLGRDAHGDYLQDVVDTLGITPVTVRADGPTALMFKAGGTSGDPEMLQVRGDTAFARHAGLVLSCGDLLDGIDHLHLTGIVFAVSPVARAAAFRLLDAARDVGITVSFDPNLRLNLWSDLDEMRRTVSSVAARAQVVLPGLGEARLLTGTDDPAAVADLYLSAGAREVAVKLGDEGAIAFEAGRSVRSRRFQVDAVDTVGAGDGFAAGYIAAMLAGEDLGAKVDQAAAVGALVTTSRGDLAAMPTRAHVDALLTRTAARSHEGGPANADRH
nr:MULTISPECIES: sugar kinase [unclassified Frigoribacterium]